MPRLAAGPKPDVSGAHIPPGLPPVDFVEWWGGSLYAWQRPIVEALCDDARPPVAYVQVPRKNGKSFLAAVIAIDEMVRRGGQVYLIADSERNLQSALFKELRKLVADSPQLSKCVLTYKLHLECPASGGMIELRPNNLGASQSINPNVVIFDEVHMQKVPEIWEGMIQAGDAMPSAMLLGITTPGYETVSLAHDLYQAVKAEQVWGVIHEAADYQCALDDEAAILAANPVLVDRPELLERFRYDPTKSSEINHRRFRLGQWTTGATRWLPYGLWEALTGPREYVEGERLWVGFDGSYSGDSTAIVACNASGHVKVLGVWEQPGNKTWRVPRDEVNAAIHRVMTEHPTATLHPDPHGGWGPEVAAWDHLYPGRMIEFPWNSPARSVPACASFEAAVRDGRLSHDGDVRLGAHLSHATPKMTPHGAYIVKPSAWSPAKIDLAVAACIAVSEAAIAPPVEDVWAM